MTGEYLNFDPKQGYPTGAGLFYECRLCGDLVPSSPRENTFCSCKNVTVDVAACRISIKDPIRAALLRIEMATD